MLANGFINLTNTLVAFKNTIIVAIIGYNGKQNRHSSCLWTHILVSHKKTSKANIYNTIYQKLNSPPSF